MASFARGLFSRDGSSSFPDEVLIASADKASAAETVVHTDPSTRARYVTLPGRNGVPAVLRGEYLVPLTAGRRQRLGA